MIPATWRSSFISACLVFNQTVTCSAGSCSDDAILLAYNAGYTQRVIGKIRLAEVEMEVTGKPDINRRDITHCLGIHPVGGSTPAVTPACPGQNIRGQHNG